MASRRSASMAQRPPGGGEAEVEHALAVIRRLGFSFGYLQHVVIAELWRIVCSASSDSPSKDRPVVSHKDLEKHMLSAMQERLRRADFSRARVRSIVALVLEACYEPVGRTSSPDSSVFYRLKSDIDTLQDLVAKHNSFLRRVLQDEGIHFGPAEWSEFLLMAADDPPRDDDNIGLSRRELNSFRTSWCTQRGPHARNLCHDAHHENSGCNGSWLRRNPFYVDYTARRCPQVEWDAGRGYLNTCRKGQLCTDAHSQEEIAYHPDVFKTRRCKHDMSCPHRSVCPFLHTSKALGPMGLHLDTRAAAIGGGSSTDSSPRTPQQAIMPSSSPPSRSYHQGPQSYLPSRYVPSVDASGPGAGGARSRAHPAAQLPLTTTQGSAGSSSSGRVSRRSGLPRLLSELRRYGMDILAGDLQNFVLEIIFSFFSENKDAMLTHREITYRLHYRLLGYTSTMPGLETVSRTKLRGVLALLKTIGIFVCSKESKEALTTMAVRPDLQTLEKFRDMYDAGILAYASYANIVLNKEDLESILDKAFLERTGVESLLASQWSSVMQEYEERLRPFEPFWRLLNEPKTPAPTGSPSENAAQHGAMLERSAKMFDRAASKGSESVPSADLLAASLPSSGKIETLSTATHTVVTSGTTPSDTRAVVAIRPIASTTQAGPPSCAKSSGTLTQPMSCRPLPGTDIGRLLLGFISVKPSSPDLHLVTHSGEQAQ